MLVLFTVVPLVIYFLTLTRLADRLGTTDWGRIFMVCAATGGTFLTTFAVSINNHVIAAACAAIALWAYVRIVYDQRRETRWFVLCGLFAALTAANELPALAFLVLVAAGAARAGAKADTGGIPARGADRGGGPFRDQLPGPRHPARALFALGRLVLLQLSKSTASRKRAIGRTRRGSTSASRRWPSTPCTRSSGITASFRFRQFGC